MTIRVVCQHCQAKMDIKEELAGSARKCPKCKHEFVVPTPGDETADEDSGRTGLRSAAETVVASTLSTTPDHLQESQHAPSEKSSPVVAAALPSKRDDDDDSEDFMPSFLTGGEETSESKTPLPPTKDEDDEPVLSIPKIPATAKPKFKTFDPNEFADEEAPRSRRREVPASLEESRPKRNRLEDDDGLDAPPSRGSKTARSGGKGFSLPAPESTGLSDPGAPAMSGGTKDRAQAARELRQALKDSALRAPQEPETTRSIGVDLSSLASEIGLKGVAILVGAIVLMFAAYFIGDRMTGGGMKLPKLGYVTGTITYDGAPAVGAQVFFEPRDSEGKRLPKTRTSFGVADEKGEYKLMYMEGVEGVAVGKNRVWLQLPLPMLTPGEFSQANITIKDVTAGSQKIDFPVTSPPKRK